MQFHVGMKVVCIDDDWSRPNGDPPPRVPMKGAIYTISGFDTWKDWVFLKLKEFSTADDHSFCADYFRPLIEKKTTTSIEVFNNLLAPSPRKLEPV